MDALNKGDRVTRTGGLRGAIVNRSPDVITLQVADGVRVKVMRSPIEGMAPGGDFVYPSPLNFKNKECLWS